MSAVLFVWNFGSFAYVLSHKPLWHLLDVGVSPFTPALGLHFVLVFVGRRRALASVLVATYLLFGAVALAAIVGYFVPTSPLAATTLLWSALFLGAIAITASF